MKDQNIQAAKAEGLGACGLDHAQCLSHNRESRGELHGAMTAYF